MHNSSSILQNYLAVLIIANKSEQDLLKRSALNECQRSLSRTQLRWSVWIEGADREVPDFILISSLIYAKCTDARMRLGARQWKINVRKCLAKSVWNIGDHSPEIDEKPNGFHAEGKSPSKKQENAWWLVSLAHTQIEVNQSHITKHRCFYCLYFFISDIYNDSNTFCEPQIRGAESWCLSSVSAPRLMLLSRKVTEYVYQHRQVRRRVMGNLVCTFLMATGFLFRFRCSWAGAGCDVREIDSYVIRSYPC